MGNKIFYLRILVIVFAIGMFIFGCNNNILLNGTWIIKNESFSTLILSNGNYEFINSNVDQMNKGTYTVNNGKIIKYLTHIHGKAIIFYIISEKNPENKWYTKNELKQFLEPDFTDHWIMNWYGETISNYTLNDNKLTLIPNFDKLSKEDKLFLLINDRSVVYNRK